jgi:hypothetical protein
MGSLFGFAVRIAAVAVHALEGLAVEQHLAALR